MRIGGKNHTPRLAINALFESRDSKVSRKNKRKEATKMETLEKRSHLDMGRTLGKLKYGLLTDKQRAIISMGMTPYEIITDIESSLSDLVPSDRSEYLRGVTLGLFDAAKDARALRC